MSKLWLPTHQYARPHPSPSSEREDLLNRLWETRTLIVGVEDMPTEELRDRVQAQEGKMAEGHYDKRFPSKRTAPMTGKERRQASGALGEYAKWRKRRRQAAGLAPKE